jgi:hypothetical protein
MTHFQITYHYEKFIYISSHGAGNPFLNSV